MSIGDQIQALTEQWAADLGDKVPVELWCWVAKDPGEPAIQTHLASIGRTGSERITGQGDSLMDSMKKAEWTWNECGRETPEQKETRQLREKAEKLGYRLEKIEQLAEVAP